MNRNRSVGGLWATLLVFVMVAAAPGVWAAGKYKVLSTSRVVRMESGRMV
jgi:hypothetical protein